MMNTLGTTTNGFQFLLLFQLHLTWPDFVRDWLDVLSQIASLAFVKLEFIAEQFHSLCIKQWSGE